MTLFPKEIFFGALIFIKNKNYYYKITSESSELLEVI
jgi:hypothetical protein